LRAAEHVEGRWDLTIGAGDRIAADVLVNAAGAWADEVARIAGVRSLGIMPLRRTIAQLRVMPAAPASLPLVLDAAGRYYFKPAAGGRLWLSPHDETPALAADAAAEEIDVAIAIDRLAEVVDWRIERVEHAWAGLRSFAPDRLPVYGFDCDRPAFFWFAGQGGFGIQTAPAAAKIAASLLVQRALPDALAVIDVELYAPARFGR
jgi:D-arginine dehydrogenase